MPTPPPGRRDGPDACPGALRLHPAADGPLARVRVPGGLLTAAQARALAAVAAECSDGHLELTSRGNLQLRALRVGADHLAGRLRAAGLLPSDTHETVRNILASPLASPGSRLDVRSLVPALDRALCADPRLAGLPGRFLFALDDGRGDVAFRADAAAVPDGDALAILLAGADAGLRTTDAVAGLLAAAHAFLDERAAQGGAAWRLAELSDGPSRVAAGALRRPGPWRSSGTARRSTGRGERHGIPLERRAGPVPVGVVQQGDGRVAVAALVPLGRLDGRQLAALAGAGERLIVTPWRGVVVPGLTDPAPVLAALAAAGLEVAPGSRWAGVTACAGQPGCANAHADVRADAAASTLHGTGEHGTGLPVHWVGCARGCGSPAGDHVRVEATPGGYLVGGRPVTGGDLAAAVAAAR